MMFSSFKGSQFLKRLRSDEFESDGVELSSVKTRQKRT